MWLIIRTGIKSTNMGTPVLNGTHTMENLAALISLYHIEKNANLSVVCVPFYQHGLTTISICIGDYSHYTVWDEITYPFTNFNIW